MRRSKKTNDKVLKLNLRLNYTVVYVVMGIRRKSAVMPNGCIVKPDCMFLVKGFNNHLMDCHEVYTSLSTSEMNHNYFAV